MRALVFGSYGLLGPYILRALGSIADVHPVGHRSGAQRCDITDASSVLGIVDSLKPDLVVNCAAMTNVDACEAEPDAAIRHNAESVRNIVSALGGSSIFIHLSTDQVYPDTEGPHQEVETGPVNTYGRSKLQGEFFAAEHPNSLILRANFFGPSQTAGRTSLSDWVVDNLAGQKPIRLFSDSLFSPLHIETLADTTLELAGKGARGTFNLGSREGCSKAEFAFKIADHLGLSTHNTTVSPSREDPTRAPRPRDMRMSVEKIEAQLGRKMPALSEEIAKL